MADHAILSASGAHRWLACTPSARFELQFPKSTSAYAEEGTLAHSVAELTTRFYLGEIDENTYEDKLAELSKSSYFTDEMLEHAESYAKFIMERLAEAKKVCADPVVILESRLDFSKYVPEGFGTGDCLIIAEPVLDVIDYKYGKGHRVEAEGNPQMKLYGLGALAEYEPLYDIQPRLSGVCDSAELSVKELKSWGTKTVKPRAKLADKGEGEFAPSEETCRFCRARAQCKAGTDKNLALFDESPDPLTITAEEAGAILAKADDIEGWLKDLKELVSKALTAGEEVTGWKMVEGRSNRRFTDEDQVVAAMKAAGYDEALLYERKLITLTKMEKDFGKKTVAEVLKDLIVKPQGAPTLAPEKDKRPAYQFEEQVLAGVFRARYNRQARVIRVQWFVILGLLLALAVSLVFRPFAPKEIASPAPTPALQQAVPALQAETASPELTPSLISLGEFKLTAYCACEKCCGKAPGDPYYGITAYGYQVTAGRTIAVDPDVIPIGSEVVINGHTYIAEDVGGAIKENRIDIYFNTHQEALEFGVQYAEVFINQ